MIYIIKDMNNYYNKKIINLNSKYNKLNQLI